MSEFTDEQIEAETEKMVEGQIAEHLEMLGDRDYLVPHDLEDAYGSWLAVAHAARRLRDAHPLRLCNTHGALDSNLSASDRCRIAHIRNLEDCRYVTVWELVGRI